MTTDTTGDEATARPKPLGGSTVSARARAAATETAHLEALIETTGTFEAADPEASVFTFGNPHEMPLAGLVDALRRSAEPRSVDWFAYKASDEEPRAFLAQSLSDELGLAFEAEDVALTAGAFGAIGLAFHLLTDPGDEVVIPKPGWFLYAPMLRLAGAVPVEGKAVGSLLALKVEAFEPDVCPFCAKGMPITKPGASDKKV